MFVGTFHLGEWEYLGYIWVVAVPEKDEVVCVGCTALGRAGEAAQEPCPDCILQELMLSTVHFMLT